MEKGRRNVILVEHIHPCVRVRPCLVGVVRWSPLLPGQLTPSALAVRALEPIQARDDRVLPRSGPRRLAATVSAATDLDHMKGHGQPGDGHVAQGMPGMPLPGEFVGGPAIDGDDAMQHSGGVSERGGTV